MVSEKLPITFFERISKLILGKIPDFFKKEINIEDDFRNFKDARDYKAEEYKSDSIKNKQNLKKLKDELKILEAEKNAHEFFCEYNKNEIAVIESIYETIDGKLELSGQDALNANYISNLGLTVCDDNLSYEQRKSNHENVIKRLLKAIHDLNFYGKKIFRLEEAITEELIITDCSNIDDEFFQLPFDAICFHVPYNNYINIRGDLLEWVFITQNDITEIRSDFNLFCVNKSGAFYTGEFFLQGGDISKQIKLQIVEKYGNSKIAIKENIELFSFITSIILYLNSENVSETKIVPDRSFKEKTSSLPICSLGRNIMISKTNYESENKSEQERKYYILKWTVRGHFRKQKCGSGRNETKIIWIRPFLKGKERLNDKTKVKPSNYIIK